MYENIYLMNTYFLVLHNDGRVPNHVLALSLSLSLSYQFSGSP
jgi:hypothetical protein